MILRKAKLDDFESYKFLRQDEYCRGYQWIYSSDYTSKKENKESKMTAEKYFGEEFLKILEEEYNNYTIERFEKDLKSDIILIAEKDSELVGYFYIFCYGNGKYKIAEWALLNPNDEQAKHEMLRLLLTTKLPRLRKFSICVINEKAKKMLIENGFIPSSAANFLSYEIVKK